MLSRRRALQKMNATKRGFLQSVALYMGLYLVSSIKMLRKTMFGLGLMGMLSSDANGEDIDYTSLSHAESFRLVHEKAKSVSYDTWKKEVLEYDGAAIVFFNSSCNTTENADNLDRNMGVVYLQLMDKFKTAKVNDLPLKFAAYDVCGKSKADLLMVNDIETRMYLDGREIDRRVGGPVDAEKISNSIKACTAWIESNILGIPYVKDGQDMRVVYNGTTGATFVPF